MIDTHAHIYLDDFDTSIDAVIQRAMQSGVQAVLLPSIDAASISKVEQLCLRYPGYCYPMLGLHPCYISDSEASYELKQITESLGRIKPVAIGEIGLDLYWKKDTLPVQISFFEQQMDWAQKLNLPVALHTRDAFDETLSIVKQFKHVTGVFHCFTGTIDEAHKAIDAGYLLGIGGVITYKSSKLKEVLKAIGPHSLLLETDSPYLAPVPHRGLSNEPSFLPLVAAAIADAVGLDITEVEAITDQNARKLFKL